MCRPTFSSRRPTRAPLDELFKRSSSFQESLEAELKTHYKTEDACRHSEYRKELLLLLRQQGQQLLAILLALLTRHSNSMGLLGSAR